MQSTPDWSGCITWMDETIQTTSTTTPTPDSLKSTGVYPAPEAKTFQLEDGSIRVEVGTFWKVVSSWHLVDSPRTNSSKPGVITTGSELAGGSTICGGYYPPSVDNVW